MKDFYKFILFLGTPAIAYYAFTFLSRVGIKFRKNVLGEAKLIDVEEKSEKPKTFLNFFYGLLLIGAVVVIICGLYQRSK